MGFALPRFEAFLLLKTEIENPLLHQLCSMNPDGTENLLQVAGHLAQAMDTHWFWNGVNQDSKQDLQNKVEHMRGALRLETTARSTRDLAINRLGIADKALRKWLTNARLVVMLARGARWSESWIPTGFTNPKMRVPKQLDQRITLARALVSFFARHPEVSVAFAEITAARGRAIYERVIQSSEMLQMAKDDFVLSRSAARAAQHDVQDLLRRVVPAKNSRNQRWSHLMVNRKRPGRRRNRRSAVKPAPIPFVQEHTRTHRVAAA